MFLKLAIVLMSFLITTLEAEENFGSVYNGFRSANLTRDGIAKFTPRQLLWTFATNQRNNTTNWSCL